MDKSKGQILIVDDDPHAVEILTLMLGREGYECASATSGAAALDRLHNGPMDVILLDVMMPEMDGLQVCERLRQDETLREIPVILLTAKVQAADRRRFTELGVRSMIAKPFDPLRLAEDVAAALEGR